MTPKATPAAAEPACAETVKAGVHMLLPTAPAHSLHIPLSWGWARGPCRRGFHSQWVVEVGERLQGTAWGSALRVASTALPTTRHCLDFFLCWDTLPSPGPSRLGNSLISLIPASLGAKPPPGPPHHGYQPGHGRRQIHGLQWSRMPSTMLPRQLCTARSPNSNTDTGAHPQGRVQLSS